MHISISPFSESQLWAFFPSFYEKRENQWRVSGGFPFQYFVSCGVFISWAVTNKAHLIEISIYFLKVLVRRKKKKKKRLHFLLEISHTHIRCSVALTRLPGMKYDLMFSTHFQSPAFSGISFLRRHVKEAVSSSS